MMIPPYEGGLKEAIDEQSNIIIVDFTLWYIIPTQPKKMSSHHNVSCGCECYISEKSMNYYLLTWFDFYLKKLKDQIYIDHIRRYG